jgi:hypothetical protein
MNELLKTYNLTVPEIAEWLGISANQVYGWRGGKIGFKKMHLLAMAACIEVKKNESLNVIADPYGWLDHIDEIFESLMPDEDMQKTA